MEFSIEFYATKTGNCPVEDFFDEMKEQDAKDYATVMAKLDKLKYKSNHHEPLTKSIGNGLLELRHVGRLNTRVIWFYVKGRRIIAVHGIRNKAKKIRKQELEIALSRKIDWVKRNAS
jgi:phage-related protein